MLKFFFLCETMFNFRVKASKSQIKIVIFCVVVHFLTSGDTETEFFFFEWDVLET